MDCESDKRMGYLKAIQAKITKGRTNYSAWVATPQYKLKVLKDKCLVGFIFEYCSKSPQLNL